MTDFGEKIRTKKLFSAFTDWYLWLAYLLFEEKLHMVTQQ